MEYAPPLELGPHQTQVRNAFPPRFRFRERLADLELACADFQVYESASTEDVLANCKRVIASKFNREITAGECALHPAPWLPNPQAGIIRGLFFNRG